MKIFPGLVVLLSLAAVASVEAADAAKAPTAAKPPATKMGSGVFDWKELKVEERPNGVRRPVFDSMTESLARFESHITTLNPGADSGALHAHTGEEAIFVHSGIVEVTINDTKKTVGPGSVLYYAGKDLTQTRNPGPAPVTYIVFSIHVTPEAPAAAAK